MLLTQLELNRGISQIYVRIYQKKKSFYEVTLQHFIYLCKACFLDWEKLFSPLQPHPLLSPTTSVLR